jgi:hypothetical protein
LSKLSTIQNMGLPADIGQSTNEVATTPSAGQASHADQPAPKKQKGQGWYARMTEEQKAQYLLKQRETRQRKRAIADSIKIAQTSATPGITNVFTTVTNIITTNYYSCFHKLYLSIH